MNLPQEVEQALRSDMLGPIERYEAIKNQGYSIELPLESPHIASTKTGTAKPVMGELILFALHAFDSVIRSEMRTNRHFYLYDDSSAKFLIEMALGQEVPSHVLVTELLLLDQAKLIYRFTCAKKFGIEDQSIKQLRINSWGTEYISHAHLANIFAPILERFEPALHSYVVQNRKAYARLVNSLSATEMDDSRRKQISAFSSGLELRLLS